MKKVWTTKRSPIPADLATALASNPKADRIFQALPPSHRREYIKWITEAKKPQTRQRRVANAVQKVIIRQRTA